MNHLEYYKSKLLDLTNDVVIITDNNKESPIIQYVNKAFEQVTGYTQAEVIGRTPRMLQGAKTDKNTLKQIKMALINRPLRKLAFR